MKRFTPLSFLSSIRIADSNIKTFCKGWSAFMVLGWLLALSGCAAVQVRLGMKTYLNKIPVTSMDAKLAKGTAIAPGEKLPLVVAFTDPTGKVWVTEGEGHGKILWKDITVTPTVVTANKKGHCLASFRSPAQRRQSCARRLYGSQPSGHAFRNRHPCPV